MLGRAAPIALVLPACFAPPALLPPRDVDLQRALRDFPAGTEQVELRTREGTTLRGVFVPAGPQAPVVLHLLASADSIGTWRLNAGALVTKLVDQGFASIAFDYEGIGISEGSASVDNLARDAQLFYAAAVRRAGGEPQRVVLRATSLGTLCVATLLEAGERPGAAVLLAPVLGDSATGRFAREFRGRIVGGFASLAFRDIVDVDLLEVLSAADVPLRHRAS